MKNISVIIDGDRFDSVEVEESVCCDCDLRHYCRDLVLTDLCCIEDKILVFKKSTKSFEP
jgi:hypothetical protein